MPSGRRRGDLRLRHRFGGGEQQGFGDAYALRHATLEDVAATLRTIGKETRDIRHHARPLRPAAGRVLIQSGANGLSWRRESLPSLTISRVAENAEARTVRRNSGVTQ